MGLAVGLRADLLTRSKRGAVLAKRQQPEWRTSLRGPRPGHSVRQGPIFEVIYGPRVTRAIRLIQAHPEPAQTQGFIKYSSEDPKSCIA
jgi:hypothetical protein